jgi:predicted TPR repeat methyltransferase
MKHDPLASSDVIAERRFAYAKAVAKGGDLSAAADLFEQALERAPSWAAAWFALGETREKLGDLDGAAAAFGATVAVDPADAHGAAARLALIGHGGVPDVLPQAYVARLFDGYAPRFDKHLTKNLFYRGPALIGAALDAVAPGRRFASAVDFGCGTGLVGEALRGRIDYLTGVDLSPAMIAKARERGVYDRLIVGDATALLMCEPPGAFDLIVAADALVYVGDLAPLFAAAGTALVADGLFTFSVETFVGDGFRLEPTMRFAHARSYVEATASETGLRPLLVQSAWARREAGTDVPGLICVFETAERRNGAEGSRAVSGQPPGTPDRAEPMLLPRDRSRLRGPVSHPAVAGAVGLPFDRREPTIGEIPASRIAERPPAGGFTNVLEPEPSHLSDLGFAKHPHRPPVPG